MEEPNPILKRNSTDIGWDYGILCDANNLDRVKCKLCGKEVTGGIYRIKQHIGHIKGTVAKCPKSSTEDQEKCKTAIEEAQKKKKEKNKYTKEIREEVHIVDQEDDDVQVGSSTKRPRVLGPLDEFVLKINPDSKEAKLRMRQKHITDSLWKERTNDVHRYMARWVFEAGIPFHSIDNDSFKRFVEAVGQFGPGYQPPSQWLLRERLLKEEVEFVKKSLKEHEEEWERNGCSIMTDAWTDRKRRSIMNLCVNCTKGTIFRCSNEDSQEAHTGEYIFNYIDGKIDDIGAQKIIQVVTDNASNNMAACKLLLEKRPNMFWTSCATHTVNLMLEGIGKQPKFKNIVEKAKSLTIFIYAHHTTLAMMRKFTKKRDIVRPGVTRFASNFLTLQSLMEKKEKLRNMFSSDVWSECKWSKHSKGRQAYAIVVSQSFWNGVNLCLKVFAPLVSVLRLVDGDRKPAMGFVYGELKQAKEKIKVALKNIESHYRPIIDVIDQKSGGRLDSPLHLAAYILNPYYFYKDQSIEKEPFVMEALITCVEKIFPDDFNAQKQLINVELLKYKKKGKCIWKSRCCCGMCTQ